MMQEFINIISNNITELRKKNCLTQAEFGSKFNYSDKSVSKWERGDAIPDLIVLKKMSEAFGVPIEYFFSENHEEEKEQKKMSSFLLGNRIAISLLISCFFWLVAAVIFVYTSIYRGLSLWTCFIWPVPLTMLAVIVMNRRYFDEKYRYELYFSSAFIWSLLAALYLQFLSYNIWIIFFIGVPLQAAFILIDILKKYSKKNKYLS